MINKNISAGAERVANLFGRSLIEGGHKAGCACNFCKNFKGKGFGKKKDAEPEKEAADPTEPEEVKEDRGQVKLSSGSGPSGAAARFRNMTSKQQDTDGWKVSAYVDSAAQLSGMDKSGQKQGFKNKSMGQTTGGKALPKTRAGESMPSRTARRIAEALLD